MVSDRPMYGYARCCARCERAVGGDELVRRGPSVRSCAAEKAVDVLSGELRKLMVRRVPGCGVHEQLRSPQHADQRKPILTRSARVVVAAHYENRCFRFHESCAPTFGVGAKTDRCAKVRLYLFWSCRY